MKRITGTFFAALLTLISSATFAQEQELNTFQKELNFYIDYLLGKAGPQPIKPDVRDMYGRAVDKAFRSFVAHNESYKYPKLITAQNDPASRFLRLDGRVYINIKTCSVNNKTYAVYGYESASKSGYLIKETETNTIVYEGSNNDYLVENIFWLDDAHLLIIEESGDVHYSRTAFVVSTKKQPWANIKGFLGRNISPVAKTTPIRLRENFQLYSDGDNGLISPDELVRISFDAGTKTLSYRQYSSQYKFKTIIAKWENERFVLDDYNVHEQLSGNGGPASPYR